MKTFPGVSRGKNSGMLWCYASLKPAGCKRELRQAQIVAYSSGERQCHCFVFISHTHTIKTELLQCTCYIFILDISHRLLIRCFRSAGFASVHFTRHVVLKPNPLVDCLHAAMSAYSDLSLSCDKRRERHIGLDLKTGVVTRKEYLAEFFS